MGRQNETHVRIAQCGLKKEALVALSKTWDTTNKHEGLCRPHARSEMLEIMIL